MEIDQLRLKNVERLLSERDWKRRQLAEKMGLAEAQVGHWFMDEGKEGHRPITGKMARRIETAGDKPRGWLDQEHDVVVAEPAHPYVNGDDVLPVRVYDAEGSMGPGKLMKEHDTVVGRMELSRDWVRRHLPSISAPSNLAVITAYGDSMEPTFRDGDILLVDRGVLEIKLDAVYVLGRAEELFVKRVQRRLNGDIVIKSDNPLLDSETVPADQNNSVKVLGRVVWAWNGRRL